MRLGRGDGPGDRAGDGPGRPSRSATAARRVRVAVGLSLVLAPALWTDVLIATGVVGSLGTPAASVDPVTLSEARYRPVLAKLPPRGVVGYRPSGPLRVGRNHELEGEDRAIVRYVLAQYVLAPRVLDLDEARARATVLRDDLEPVRATTNEER